MLKVGGKIKRKRKETKKERQKAHKFDCQDACSRFSASCLIHVPETSPRSQKTKYETRSTLNIMS